jgi:DNA polymerase theta
LCWVFGLDVALPPSTAQIKVGFSLAHVEILKSVLRNSLTSPGEEFWNATIECVDGISA